MRLAFLRWLFRPEDVRDFLRDFLFPAAEYIEVPSTPDLACPHCGMVHANLKISSAAHHVTVRCTCKGEFDIYPRANWRTRAR